MAAETPAQKKTIDRVMHEFKHGELKSAGGKVKNPKQAVAIALSEAGASNRRSASGNKRRLAETKRKERAEEAKQDRGKDGPTRAALYAEAGRKRIAGRSKMTKAGLQAALAAAR